MLKPDEIEPLDAKELAAIERLEKEIDASLRATRGDAKVRLRFFGRVANELAKRYSANGWSVRLYAIGKTNDTLLEVRHPLLVVDQEASVHGGETNFVPKLNADLTEDGHTHRE
jgi:hypothetical protein